MVGFVEVLHVLAEASLAQARQARRGRAMVVSVLMVAEKPSIAETVRVAALELLVDGNHASRLLNDPTQF